jgi:hypothetical protein
MMMTVMYQITMPMAIKVKNAAPTIAANVGALKMDSGRMGSRAKRHSQTTNEPSSPSEAINTPYT